MKAQCFCFIHFERLTIFSISSRLLVDRHPRSCFPRSHELHHAFQPWGMSWCSSWLRGKHERTFNDTVLHDVLTILLFHTLIKSVSLPWFTTVGIDFWCLCIPSVSTGRWSSKGDWAHTFYYWRWSLLWCAWLTWMVSNPFSQNDMEGRFVDDVIIQYLSLKL